MNRHEFKRIVRECLAVLRNPKLDADYKTEMVSQILRSMKSNDRYINQCLFILKDKDKDKEKVDRNHEVFDILNKLD